MTSPVPIIPALHLLGQKINPSEGEEEGRRTGKPESCPAAAGAGGMGQRIQGHLVWPRAERTGRQIPQHRLLGFAGFMTELAAEGWSCDAGMPGALVGLWRWERNQRHEKRRLKRAEALLGVSTS
ncbi:hypothetical protein BKA81DRAFT_372715 [Phyllosticta paracitricarpa]